jgi:hypothetical protein
MNGLGRASGGNVSGMLGTNHNAQKIHTTYFGTTLLVEKLRVVRTIKLMEMARLTGLARLHLRVGVEARAAHAAPLGGGCRGSEVLEGEHRAQTKFGPIMLFIQFILP